MLTPEQKSRYSRHLLIPEVGAEGQSRLLDSKVLFIGAGGLGSPAMLYMAAAGVGTIGIVDFDVVDGSLYIAVTRTETGEMERTRIDIDTNSGAIQATVTAGSAVDWPKTLVLLLSHPAFAARDQSITLTASRPDDAGNPSWTGHFVGVPEGRWYMVLADGDAWRLTGTWSGASTAELVPASAYGDAGR